MNSTHSVKITEVSMGDSGIDGMTRGTHKANRRIVVACRWLRYDSSFFGGGGGTITRAERDIKPCVNRQAGQSVLKFHTKNVLKKKEGYGPRSVDRSYVVDSDNDLLTTPLQQT